MNRGIEALIVDTHNFGKCVAFWKGRDVAVDQPVAVTPVLTVSDRSAFEPPRGGAVARSFEEPHGGVTEMRSNDPDGPTSSIQSPLVKA